MILIVLPMSALPDSRSEPSLASSNNFAVHVPVFLQIKVRASLPTADPAATGALAIVNGCDSDQPKHPNRIERMRTRTCCPACHPEFNLGISMRVAENEDRGRIVAVTMRVFARRRTRLR